MKPVREIVYRLGQVAQNWLNPKDPIRKEAESSLTDATGYSRAMIQRALEETFQRLRKEALLRLLRNELGGRMKVLDRFTLYDKKQKTIRARASGHDVILHLLSGNIPGIGIPSIVYGLLTKSGNLVKVASEEPFLARLFARSVEKVDETLGKCISVAYWKGGEREIEDTAFASVSLVVATGSDETLSDIQKRIPYPVRFIPYGHKISFGIIGKVALTLNARTLLYERAALDVAVYDQQGCLSPHMFFVQEGGKKTPREFAIQLLEALGDMENTLPPRFLSLDEKLNIRSFLSRYEFHPNAEIFQSPSGRSVVIFLPESRLPLSCLNRVIFVVPFSGISQVLETISGYVGKISTVSVAVTRKQLKALMEPLHRLGVSRICPVGWMQLPSAVWHRDNRPVLSDFLLWTDWEYDR